MSRREKTLKEIYEQKLRIGKLRKKLLIISLVIIFIGGTVYAITEKDFVFAKYQKTTSFLKKNQQESVLPTSTENDKQEVSNKNESSSSLEWYELWKSNSDDYDETNSENNYYTSTSEPVVVYQRDNTDDVGLSERTWEMINNLQNQSSKPTPPSSSNSSTGTGIMPSPESEFDVNACISRCDSLSTTFYNTCVSAYEKYVKSAQEAYNNSLYSCISDLGRNDPICKTNAQKLYDQYMSSPVAKNDKAYCKQQKEKLDSTCYQNTCVK